MAKGLDGATTVSATMLLAARAGIQVFVTGGAVFLWLLALGRLQQLLWEYQTLECFCRLK